MVLELLFEYGERESSSVAQISNVVQLGDYWLILFQILQPKSPTQLDRLSFG